MSFVYFCFFSFILVSETFGCSCVNYQSESRTRNICDGFGSENDVYIATVEAAYCKCRPDAGVTEEFSCIRYWQTQSGGVEGMTQSTYTCNIPYQFSNYLECSKVTRSATGSDSQTVDPITSPIVNLSNETDCGFDNSDYESDEGCDLTIQPCYYTVRVSEVFKGNYNINQTLDESGPDVVITCGNPDRVLEIGEDYVVGIGGGCIRINEWDPVASYSSDELQLLRQLMNGNGDVCGSTVITVTFTLFILLLLIALFI